MNGCMQESECLSAECDGLKITIVAIPNKAFSSRNIAMHMHMNYEIHVLYQGSARIETEKSTYFLNPGEVALICPNVYHSVYNESENFSLVSMNFTLYRSRQDHNYYEFENILRNLATEEVIILGAQPDIASIVNAIRNENMGKNLWREQMLHAMLECFFVRMIRALYTTYHGKENQVEPRDIEVSSTQAELTKAQRMNLIESYMAAEYQTATMAELSSKLLLSPQHVRRFLRDEYGLSFTEMLNKHRIYEGKKMLTETSMSITDISNALGFTNQRSFTLLFNRFIGCTPSAYRLKKKNSIGQ